MMSLFEYLGKPAGEHLGKEVYLASRAKNVDHSTRQVSTKTYTGMVMTYPEWFLKEYFSQSSPPTSEGVVDDEGEDLPF